MDPLEVWRVRGRVATAVRATREAASRFIRESKELADALAEAESLDLYGEPSTPASAGAVQ